MARGAQGRTTKNKAQISAYGETTTKAKAVIQKGDEGAPDLGGQALRASGNAASARGGLLSLKNVTVEVPGRGPILNGVSFDFQRGMKIGIVGPNGAGKSTFLKVAAGVIDPSTGEREEGSGVRIGYLAQDPPPWPDLKQKVMDIVGNMASEVLANDDSGGKQELSRERATARLLSSVNFPEERWYTAVESLSGGERRRLQLLRVLAAKPNILLLDEPTNDLDAVTVDSLETLLQDWPGTLVMVSHDRSLLDGVCNKYIVFNAGGDMRVWSGSHDDLMAFERANAKALSDTSMLGGASSKRTGGEATKRKAPKADESDKELKRLESSIEKVDAELAEVSNEMEQAGTDASKVMVLYNRQQELEALQADLYGRWEQMLPDE